MSDRNLGINWGMVQYMGVFTMGFGWAYLDEDPLKALLLLGIGLFTALAADRIKKWQ